MSHVENSLQEFWMAVTAVDVVVKQLMLRAKNDEENALVWECAAEVASDVTNSLMKVIDELEAEQNGIPDHGS